MADKDPSSGRGRRQIAFWCLYDWASSAFPAIVLSFVFAPYFLEQVAADPVSGQAQWGFSVSASAIAIAALSPLFGAFADRGGRRRSWLGGCTLIAVLTTVAMWRVAPGRESLMLALALLVVANAAFELAYVFYNALLSEVARPEATGRVSGLGWGAGYLGSLASLGLVYGLLFAPEPPPFGLDAARAEPARMAAVITALWYLVFSVPLIFFGPREKPSSEPALRIVANGFRDLWCTLGALPRMPSIAWFLLAHMFFIDGVNTIFVFGPLIAKGVFGFSEIEMLALGVTIYVAAGLGAIAFGWLDDWAGAKAVVAVSIAALVAISLSIFLIETRAAFWLAAGLLGIFFGPVQASSRSLMARLAPDSMRTKLFGLYALAGRAIGPFGAALVGWVTLVTESQKGGLIVIAALLLLGLALLMPVREARLTEPRRA